MKRISFLCLLVLAGLKPEARASSSYYHYLQGSLHERLGEYAQALEEYQAVLKSDPGAISVRREVSQLELRLGKVDEALASAEEVQKQDPKNPHSYLLMGLVHLARNELPEALASYQKVLQLDPNNAEALLRLGSLLTNSQPRKALDYYKRYLAFSPDAPDVYYQMALLHEELKEPQEAKAHLEQALRLDPGFLQARLSLAQIYEVESDTATAVQHYQQALDQDPDSKSLLTHVGYLLMIQGKAETAEPFFKRALVLDPQEATANFWMAVLSEVKNDWPGAARYQEKAAAASPDWRLLLRLSYYWSQAGQTKKAVQVLQQAQAKEPKDAEIYFFLALGYEDLGQKQKALASLEKALELKPRFPEAQFRLGALYDSLGETQKAETQFHNIIRQEPANALALNYLGYSYAERAVKLAEAEKLVLAALAQQPQNGAFLDSLGWVYFRQGRFSEAVAKLLQAKNLVEDPVVFEHLGDAFQAQGQLPESWAAYQEALALSPKNEVLRRKIKTLEKALPEKVLEEQTHRRFQDNQQRIQQLKGFFFLTGRAWGQGIHLQGMCYYQAPKRLRIDLLGPFGIPQAVIFKKGETFAVIPKEQELLLQKEARVLTEIVQDFFHGFTAAPKNFKLRFDRKRGLVTECLYQDSQAQIRTKFSRYQKIGLIWMPTSWQFSSKELKLKLNLRLENSLLNQKIDEKLFSHP